MWLFSVPSGNERPPFVDAMSVLLPAWTLCARERCSATVLWTESTTPLRSQHPGTSLPGVGARTSPRGKLPCSISAARGRRSVRDGSGLHDRTPPATSVLLRPRKWRRGGGPPPSGGPPTFDGPRTAATLALLLVLSLCANFALFP